MTSSSSHAAGGAAYRPDIDGLRAIAVGAVLVFHAGMAGLPGGFVGVDVFFVISGFLITAIIARESDEGRFTYGDFYERRIRRIYPALMVVLVATLIVATLVMVPLDFRRFGRTLVWTPLFASNFAFMGQAGYFDPDGATKPLLHTWSLGVEEQFYIVFPLVLMAVKRWGWNRSRAVVAIVAASFAGSVAGGIAGWGDAYFLLPTRFWELGIGALLALTPWRPASTGLRAAIGGIGLAAIVGSMLLIDETMAFPGWVAAVPVLGSAAVILAEVGPAARLLSTAPFVFVGRISYPMYLWHWPLIVFAQMYFFHPLTGIEGVGVVVATILLSWATMVAIETPIRSRRVLAGRRALFAVATLASLALVAAGLFVFNTPGLERWTTPEQRAVLAPPASGRVLSQRCPAIEIGVAGEHPDCILGRADGTPPRFAVLGDSHAGTVVDTLSDEAERLGLAGLFFGRAACPPILTVDRPITADRRCTENLEAALARIAAADVRTVIVVSRWTLTVTGHDYARSPAQLRPLLVDGRMLGEAEWRDVLLDRLGRTFDRLAGRRVIVVAPVPEVRFDVPVAFANALRLGRPPPPGPTRAELDDRRRSTLALLDAAAAGRPWVSRLDPADLLCDAERCAIGDAGGPLYRDPDHLSKRGADRLAPLFAEALATALAPPAPAPQADTPAAP